MEAAVGTQQYDWPALKAANLTRSFKTPVPTTMGIELSERSLSDNVRAASTVGLGRGFAGNKIFSTVNSAF